MATKRGRPYEDNREVTETLTIKITVSEKAALKKAAQDNGMSMSQYIGYLCAHQRDGLLFLVDRATFGPVLDLLRSDLVAAGRKAARQEARLVLIEEGFSTRQYEG